MASSLFEPSNECRRSAVASVGLAGVSAGVSAKEQDAFFSHYELGRKRHFVLFSMLLLSRQAGKARPTIMHRYMGVTGLSHFFLTTTAMSMGKKK